MTNILIKELSKNEKLDLSKKPYFSLPYKPPTGKLIDEWPCFLLSENEIDVAYISLEIHPPSSEILWFQNICVVDSKKRLGYGSKLVNYCLEYAKSNNYKKVSLYAHKNYTFEFWKSLGFIENGSSGESLIFEKKLVN